MKIAAVVDRFIAGTDRAVKAADHAPVAFAPVEIAGGFVTEVPVQIFGVHEVRRILEQIEIAARPDLGGDPADVEIIVLEIGQARQLRGFALSQIDEDQAEILLHRIALDLHPVAERALLPGLRHTLSGRVVGPSVIGAFDVLAMDKPEHQLHTSMRASSADDVGGAGFAAIERQILAENADRLDLAGCKVGADKHRVPEAAKVAAGDGTGPDAQDVRVTHPCRLFCLFCMRCLM